MRLYIVDDYFPLPLSSFRVAEYNWYLAAIQECYAFSLFRDFERAFRDYESMFPELSRKVRHAVDMIGRPDLYYTVFINNAFNILDVFEAVGAPFSFTLYPGGGFQLDVRECDAMLERVGASEMLDAVITTQKTTRDYVLERGFFPEDRVHFIYGGVLDSGYFRENSRARPRYGAGKGTFDICFVATRYDPRGASKGYDVFLEVAGKLARLHPDFRFHVVGGMWPGMLDELDPGFLGDRIRQYGFRQTPFFPAFYSGMDMILSPNRAFADPSNPGGFDGFPTACCVEAGMCGTAVLCADPLDDNVAFTDGLDIRIIPPEAEEVCEIVCSYFDDPESLYRLGERCRESFLRVFDLEAQLSERARVLGLRSAAAAPEARGR